MLEPSLRACRDAGDTCGLLPLDAAQAEALLQSVFGDVPGVSTVATAIFGHCQGNPRTTLEMAQHLVDTGKAHYDLGGWTLPARVESGDLPGDWAELLGERLQELDQGAREWAEVMACAQPYGLPPALFQRLTDSDDTARRDKTVDALMAVGLLQDGAGWLSFVSTAVPEQVLARTATGTLHGIYGRLASLLRTEGHGAAAVARCQLRADRAGDAVDTRLSALKVESLKDAAPADYATVLEQAIDACTGMGARGVSVLRCFGSWSMLANISELPIWELTIVSCSTCFRTRGERRPGRPCPMRLRTGSGSPKRLSICKLATMPWLSAIATWCRPRDCAPLR